MEDYEKQLSSIRQLYYTFVCPLLRDIFTKLPVKGSFAFIFMPYSPFLLGIPSVDSHISHSTNHKYITSLFIIQAPPKEKISTDFFAPYIPIAKRGATILFRAAYLLYNKLYGL
ncbi:MAG: hypothetical protein LBD29_05875 [Treponema sp.]|jgi:hypothetical protein|nr:hypothetical protein [Treponema sp.]